VPFQIVKPGTHIDFLGRWKIAVAISLLVIVAGLAAIPIKGFRLGIDFAGGNEVQVHFTGEQVVDEGLIRQAIQGLDIENPSVVRFGELGSNEFLIKFRGERRIGSQEETGGEVNAKTDRILALGELLVSEIGPMDVERVEFVGPKVGRELREAGIQSMLVACLCILAYIAFRFSLRFAPGAVVALVHDVLITSSIWILLGLEFDLKVLAALLAIIGYSLNDTIIVYDRIRENMELRTTLDFPDVLNQSVNQTLSRTLLTSITTLVALLALLIVAGVVIRPFALAMTIGVVVGTYSSIFIAAPTLMWLERRFGGTPASAPAATGKPKANKANQANKAKKNHPKSNKTAKPARA